MRSLVLAGLVLTLVVSPVLGAIGEMHELTHATQLASHHAGHDALVEDAGIVDEGDGAAALHVVHSFVHCCGQTAAVGPAALAVLPAADLKTLLQRFELRPVATARLQDVFRPPIKA